MPGVAYDKANGNRFLAGILGVVVGPEWTDRFRAFVEIAGQSLTSSRHDGPVIAYDIGAAYLLRKNLQIGRAFSWGANRSSPDFSWTVVR